MIMITLPENLVYIVIWEYETSSGISSGVSAVFINKDDAEIMQKKLDLTKITTSNTVSSDLLSTQADENLQKDLNEIKILLSEINEPSSYANATKASGRMY
jgi:hypothetical protein